MKKLLIVGVVATLSLVVGSQQRAAAQCPQQCMRGGEVSFNTGITFGCHWTPRCGHWEPNCCGPYGCPVGPYGYAAGPYGAPPRGYAPGGPPPVGPGGPPVPPPPPKATASNVQNIEYTYPTAYDYNNGYNNYGYLYGVPPYQDPGYWYGYGR